MQWINLIGYDHEHAGWVYVIMAIALLKMELISVCATFILLSYDVIIMTFF